MRSTGPMSVGHSRRTSRSPGSRAPGRFASSTWRSRSTPSFSSPAASPNSCSMSEMTSSTRISSLSSVFPARLRTTRLVSGSPSVSITVGGVIQFKGLKPPASSWTSTEPSDLSTTSRTASGRTAVRRPV